MKTLQDHMCTLCLCKNKVHELRGAAYTIYSNYITYYFPDTVVRKRYNHVSWFFHDAKNPGFWSNQKIIVRMGAQVPLKCPKQKTKAFPSIYFPWPCIKGKCRMNNWFETPKITDWQTQFSVWLIVAENFPVHTEDIQQHAAQSSEISQNTTDSNAVLGFLK